ncbi:MAG TPA: energy transducer TonB [Pyrinomonadaceae bacterium]|jgi:TonB family protein
MTYLFCIALWLSLLPAQPPPAQATQGGTRQKAEQETEKVYARKEVDTPARITRQSFPEPPRAERLGDIFRGAVRLRMIFRSNGKVTDIEVLNSAPPEIRRASIAAAQKIEFKPALKDGQPVSQYVLIEHSYH